MEKLTCFGNVLTPTAAASLSSRRNRSNLKLFERYSSLSSQLRFRHKRRVNILVLTRDLWRISIYSGGQDVSHKA